MRYHPILELCSEVFTLNQYNSLCDRAANTLDVRATKNGTYQARHLIWETPSGWSPVLFVRLLAPIFFLNPLMGWCSGVSRPTGPASVQTYRAKLPAACDVRANSPSRRTLMPTPNPLVVRLRTLPVPWTTAENDPVNGTVSPSKLTGG